MITTIHDDETNRAWAGEFSKKLPVQIQAVARRKLRMINNARRIDDLRIPPNNRLELLTDVTHPPLKKRIISGWKK
ncbi:type II toxin-antitoxin system RelE/ParE family toxin [Methylobacter svalbardensis]|uniref:type II toxin-antitoxin system RelE/ParE family toxin n=1 Tax=Methylobacter svalbardensis TaxID=3080016 RepID=UPI0030EC2DFF